MFDRVLAFLKELPGVGAEGGKPTRGDDPRVAAAALLYHVMDADGVRQDAEWERLKALLAEAYELTGAALDQLVTAGADADQDAVDLYAFTSVLKRHLDDEQRITFVRELWEVAFADGALDELEDNTLWRIAELLGVDRRDRIAARREVQSHLGKTRGKATEED